MKRILTIVLFGILSAMSFVSITYADVISADKCQVINVYVNRNSSTMKLAVSFYFHPDYEHLNTSRASKYWIVGDLEDPMAKALYAAAMLGLVTQSRCQIYFDNSTEYHKLLTLIVFSE